MSEIRDRLRRALVGPPPATTGQPPWRRVLPVALVGLLVAGLVVLLRVLTGDGFDITAPFVVGTRYGVDLPIEARGIPLAGERSYDGYDGQWYLGQALDPLLRSELPLRFDSPRYRGVRMLFPTAGWALAAGQPAATPYALLALGVLAVGLGSAAGGRIATGFRRSRWWGVGFALVPGVVVGVAYGTAEPLGLALAVTGLTLSIDRRYGWAGLAFAGAALSKETYLAFAAATAVYLAFHHRRRGEPWVRPAGLLVAPGAVVLLAWWRYVAWALPAGDDPDRVVRVFAPPLTGWVEVLGEIATGAYSPAYQIGWRGGVIMIGTLVLLLVAVGLAIRRPSLLSLSALGWAGYALLLSGLLLGRFLSAQRALAPAVLIAVLVVVATGLPAHRRGDRHRSDQA